MEGTGWRKVYRDAPIRQFWSPIGAFSTVMFIAFFVGSLQRRDYEGVLFFSGVFVAGCVAYIAWRPGITITCTPDHITIKQGTWFQTFHQQTYLWRDLLGTTYRETRTYQWQESSYAVYDLCLAFRDGFQVEISRRSSKFHELMATIGQMTPHIRYIWVRRSTAHGEPVQTIKDYVLIERATAQPGGRTGAESAAT
jgi:hypothetical protein